MPSRVGGRYEPIAKIAAGGMATVYLARAVTGVGFGKLVALKCVHPHMADDPEFVAMFLDEARLASRIDHPNVCQVFDAGEDEGTHFLAMEYLHGEPLMALMKAWDRAPEARPERFPELAARILADAAMGLHAAHELRGADGRRLDVVHRDIGPQNLFVTYAGGVKVVDFGIAKAAGRLHETSHGVVKGKVAYMSPEQLDAEDVDRRTDVWALGVTLWELLTGRRLFRRADQIKTLHAVLNDDIPPPSALEPAVPPALDAIVLRALARDLDARHPSARAFADDLEAFIAGRGAPIGMSQLEDLMRATFPARLAEKDAWVARAQAEHSVEVPPIAATHEATVSEVRPTRPTHTDPIELPVARGGLWIAAAVLVLVGLVAGFVVFLALRPEAPAPRAAAPEAAEPAPAPIAAPEPVPVEVAPSAPVEPAPAPRSRPRAVRVPAAEPMTAPPAPAAQAPVVEAPVAPAAPREIPPAGPPRAVRIAHPGGGWAELRVDGRGASHTPTTTRPLTPGPHVIELRPYGRGAWTRHPIRVESGAGPQVERIPLPPP